jgi:hypothetical protein
MRTLWVVTILCCCAPRPVLVPRSQAPRTASDAALDRLAFLVGCWREPSELELCWERRGDRWRGAVRLFGADRNIVLEIRDEAGRFALRSPDPNERSFDLVGSLRSRDRIVFGTPRQLLDITYDPRTDRLLGRIHGGVHQSGWSLARVRPRARS